MAVGGIDRALSAWKYAAGDFVTPESDGGGFREDDVFEGGDEFQGRDHGEEGSLALFFHQRGDGENLAGAGLEEAVEEGAEELRLAVVDIAFDDGAGFDPWFRLLVEEYGAEEVGAFVEFALSEAVG